MIGNWIKRTSVALALAVTVVGSATAQNGGRTPTTSRILYHGGSVEAGNLDVYFIWYGCWDNTCGTAGDPMTASLVMDVAEALGGTHIFRSTRLIPTVLGTRQAPCFSRGSVTDSGYSHGVELTASDIQGIISAQLDSGALPLDSFATLVVVASADAASAATGFCAPFAPPHHGSGNYKGWRYPYAFVGHPNRCPTVAAPQFFGKNGRQLPTPNGNLAGDAMASTLARVLNNLITDPHGDAWFDRYGLEASDKCVGLFEPTYLTPNGARANLHLGSHDFLIQQNWVNDGKGRCAMNSSQ
jgi:hypothetical protein